MDNKIIEMAGQAGLFEVTKDGYEVFYPDNLEAFAKLVEQNKINEIAAKCEKLPFGDTAQSFAAWIREQ